MNKRAERETLAAAITAHLPALEQRVRKQALAAVGAEALRRDDVSPTGFLRLASEYEQRTSARRSALRTISPMRSNPGTATLDLAMRAITPLWSKLW